MNIQFACRFCRYEYDWPHRHKPLFKNRLSFAQFVERCNSIFPDDWYQFKPTKEPFNMSDNIIVHCNRHNLTVARKGANILYNKMACPKCSHAISQGELKILKYLTDNNINYEFQKVFDFLEMGYKSYYRMDFFIPEKKICIEYDGRQHFEPAKLHGRKMMTEEDVINNQKRDTLKEELCAQHGIGVIRIKYNENIIDKLNTIFL